MNIKESAENYLEAILAITEKVGAVRSIDVVNRLGYSKASVSVAMKNLKENGYIEIDEKGYISLLESGKAIATQTYAKHNLIAKALMNIGVDEDTAFIDACKIEHDISQTTFEHLKVYLDKK